MGGSRCGYCREFNHNKRKCNKLAGEVEYIRKYIPTEVNRIHDALVEKGWGVGAMVEVTQWNGEKIVGIVDDMRIIAQNIHSFTDYRNVKYSKQVKTYLKNITGKYLENIPENILFHNRGEIQFAILNPSEPSDRLFATVTRGQLGFGEDNHYMWTTPSVLLSPSHETNASYSDFLDISIRLHDRLVLPNTEAYIKGLAI